ncbi:MAG TPA: PLP-dependent cysteine synthase family protein [Candidatus Polarisedimenticolaceae bacterium]|nr:PLP-dependent cysteine synthase family protein [Candidatus Polarisedimenticolaceae bacterium]
MPAPGLLDAVGDTPLIELVPEPPLPSGARLLAKLEFVNPGGSIKDRPVSRILTRALRAGDLGGGRRLLDSTSGNAGVAYAMFGAALGIEVTLVIPGNASRERIERIRAHGARVIETDPIEGYDFALREARRLAEQRPRDYWYANQYANEHNWLAHYESTGPEIVRQVAELTGRPADAFVAGVGTGGTLTGVGRRLREANPDLYLAAIVPETFPGIEGLKPLGAAQDLVPEILDQSLIDERFPMTMDESAETTRWLARRGLFVGPSSGAYVRAAIRLARSGRFATTVTVLSDTGERYGSTGLWRSTAAGHPRA